MNKTKIEWADYTWSPVTGCLHECSYCYARKIAKRFGLHLNGRKLNVLEEKFCIEQSCIMTGEKDIITSPYPYDFSPTFHKYRLCEPARKTKPQKIFVCSMADLFGEWVPNEWIQEVFKVCEEAPQHTYLFLTKNPSRYAELASDGHLPNNKNYWYGSTVTGNKEKRFVSPKGDDPGYSTFLSIEPLLNIWDFNPYGEFDSVKWVIVGTQTGPGAVAPKKEWVQSIVEQCRDADIPVFLKNNLKDIWEEELIQEFPQNMAE